MFICVKAPGACGELIQGSINNEPFLVTCPIDLYSAATILPQKKIAPRLGRKSQLAISKVLEYLKINMPFDSFIKISSSLPKGKGMASSSADIAAICKAIALFFDRNLTLDEIAFIAASIEPTDGIFYEGIVKINHLTGTCQEFLGNPPAMLIALFDLGGSIDTLSFNRRTDLEALNTKKESHILQALDLVRKGIRTHDTRLIGQGTTLSALANQETLYKPGLESMIKIAENCGAVGVNIAHSGTIIGILFDLEQAEGLSKSIDLAKLKCPQFTFLRTANLIPGGLKIEGDINGAKL
ncbi:GHMP family kinase ATP-binding protein [Anaerosinus massiliensis]|uniref:GHMP family kinase ATP-binding protein n=1 Tax=Massilibacillus massiliensis TaxID=1806837 RepID=UPI000A606679|nr:GHMP kinase [Massilibacillus massiliensis]